MGSVVGALEQVLVVAEEAEALEAIPEAVGLAQSRLRLRPPAAASLPEPLRVMSEVSGTFPFPFVCVPSPY